MKLSSDFECGNGKNFTRTGPLSWRFNVHADRPRYDHYFLFRLDAEEESGEVEIIVLPDNALAGLGDMPQTPWSDPPNVLWRKRGADGPWERLPQADFTAVPGMLTIRHAARAGEAWCFAEACPFPYSDITRHLENLAAGGPLAQTIRLGETPEARPLLLARVTDPDVPAIEKGRVFIIAGQHGTEYAGMFAAKGALDFLASRLPQAAALRRRYVFDVLPCANPDGSSHGRCCVNSEGKDQLVAFEGAAAGAEPGSAEARLIWNHLRDNKPDLILNFHAYPRSRPFGDPPYEGMFVPEPDALSDPDRRELQHVLNHAVFYLTDGGSQHRRPGPSPAHSLQEAAAAAWGSLSLIYEVQTEEGPHRNLRTGVNLLRTVVESLEEAQGERIGLG